MAGSKIGKGKVEAATILEVVVALVILVIISGIALTVFGNVVRSSISVKKIKAEAALQDLLVQTESESDYTRLSVTSGDLKLIREIKPFEPDPAVSVLQLSALDANGLEVATIKKLVIDEQEQR